MSHLASDTMRSSASEPRQPNTDSSNISRILDLSESRTYDCALEALSAYKLTGNFPTELEIVLRDMRVLDQLTFEIKPKSALSDRRQVEFWPRTNVQQERFDAVVRTIKDQLGVIEPPAPLWARLFR
jgi:hypothetical protein